MNILKYINKKIKQSLKENLIIEILNINASIVFL